MIHIDRILYEQRNCILVLPVDLAETQCKHVLSCQSWTKMFLLSSCFNVSIMASKSKRILLQTQPIMEVQQTSDKLHIFKRIQHDTKWINVCLAKAEKEEMKSICCLLFWKTNRKRLMCLLQDISASLFLVSASSLLDLDGKKKYIHSGNLENGVYFFSPVF